MAKDTKERLMDAALTVFARDGYAGTNLKTIAESVGIVKSAIYRHFESKEALWKEMQEEMERYYDERFGSTENIPAIPQTAEGLYELTMRMVNFTVKDEKDIRMRRILLAEQFRDDAAKRLATGYFNEGTRTLFEKVFVGMMEAGCLKKTDPVFLAEVYTAPITLWIHLSDREPEKRDTITDRIGHFVRQFIEEYGVKTGKVTVG